MSKLGYKFHRIHNTLGSYYHNPQGLSTKAENQQEINKQVEFIREKYKNEDYNYKCI